MDPCHSFRAGLRGRVPAGYNSILMSVRTKPREGKTPHRQTRDWAHAGGSKFDREAIVALVCNQFCTGVRVGDIHAELKKQGVSLTREQPYEILRWAAEEGRLSYNPPLDAPAAHRLLEEYSWLQRARVVNTPEAGDVARQGAKLLLDLMRRCNKQELHIGFAGGPMMSQTARALVELLQTQERFLERLVLHALVAAGFNLPNGPNNFLQCFLESNLPFEVDVVPLPVPGFVSTTTLAALRDQDGFSDAFAGAEQIDIFLSSAGAHWNIGCSGLNELYRRSAPTVKEVLDEHGCIGDLLWQPFAASGPIDMRHIGVGTAALLDLHQLAARVAKGARSLLILSPCGKCKNSKTEILKAILDAPERLVTDLVVDIRATNGLFKLTGARS